MRNSIIELEQASEVTLLSILTIRGMTSILVFFKLVFYEVI